MTPRLKKIAIDLLNLPHYNDNFEQFYFEGSKAEPILKLKVNVTEYGDNFLTSSMIMDAMQVGKQNEVNPCFSTDTMEFIYFDNHDYSSNDNETH